MSSEEVDAFIQSMPDEETIWIEDDRACAGPYKILFATGERTELVRLTKTLYGRKQELMKAGKKLRSTDAAILQQAEKIRFSELAMMLDIKRDEVLAFILGLV